MKTISIKSKSFFALVLLLCFCRQAFAQDHNEQKLKREVISTDKAPQSVGPYSQAIRAGDFIFVAGQGAFSPFPGVRIEGGIKEQTRQVLRNIQSILVAAGSNLERTVKVTVFLTDWKYFKEMNEAYAEFFKTNPPARSTIQGERWPEGQLVAMDVIALAK